MNIKEAFAWRTDCFLCGQELTIFPKNFDPLAVYTLTNDRFTLESKYVKFSVDTSTGSLIDPLLIATGQRADIRAFMEKLDVTFTCEDCVANHGRGLPDFGYGAYSYRIDFRCHYPARVEVDDEEIFYVEPIITETLIHINHYTFIQRIDSPEASLLPWKIANAGHLRGYEKLGIPMNLPRIDLSKTTPPLLDRKLKTYILFS